MIVDGRVRPELGGFHIFFAVIKYRFKLIEILLAVSNVHL